MIYMLCVWVVSFVLNIIFYYFVKDKYAKDIPKPDEILIVALVPIVNLLSLFVILNQLGKEYKTPEPTLDEDEDVVYESVSRTKLTVHTLEGIKCYVVDGKINTLPQEAQKELLAGELYKVVRNGKVFIEHVKGE